jgi:glutathione peroxidase
MEISIYSLNYNTPKGERVSMSEYKDKVVLIVNTATQCGLTPQFEGLEKLHQTYKDEGLEVIGFPCNQFLSQEPLSNEEMETTCEINHGVTFQLTEKIDVNGSNTHPIFQHLKNQKGGFLTPAIKWNFTKFLINRKGEVIRRFAPKTTPNKIEADIKKQLSN